MVEVLDPEGYTAETPTYVYARLTGTPDWMVLGPPADAFDEGFYQQHRIPAALRLDVLR